MTTEEGEKRRMGQAGRDTGSTCAWTVLSPKGEEGSDSETSTGSRDETSDHCEQGSQLLSRNSQARSK